MKQFENFNADDAIAGNVEWVRKRIAAACAKSRRDESSVSLIAVTKNFPSKTVRLAYNCGIHDFGESRMQEAGIKLKELYDIRSLIRLHFIGHLQSNKVKDALEISDVVHSVDSLKLAQAINQHAARKISCFIQVNVAEEKTKYGFSKDELDNAVKNIGALPNINVIGLMTIAPLTDKSEEARPVFAKLRDLNLQYGFKELSMGMTDDYEIAIEEGSTMVRIGRAIFGERS
ncbi:MAG: YggS family pyridoxal phosphate-dependent enzyme [Chloroflexi bacterium]|nr:YggS family pyridoxal phosphate-dependent enzyme [Chloroflexota bacterium]